MPVHTKLVHTVWITLSPVVTRYIQEASATSGVGVITISCTTAPSVPRVICTAVIQCSSENVTKALSSGMMEDYDTNERCDIIISVISVSNLGEILEQVIFNDVMPMIQPSTTTTATLGPNPTIVPTTGARGMFQHTT